MDNLIRDWNGKTIRQRADGYISATDMANATGKRFSNWENLVSTKEYLEALRDELCKNPSTSTQPLVDVKLGGNFSEFERGTWIHRKVALRFAQWCNPLFAVRVDTWVEELLLKGSVSIASNDTHIKQLPPGVLPQESVDQCIALLQFYDAYETIYGYNQGLLHDINNDISLIRGLSTQSTTPQKRQYLSFKNVELVNDFEFFHCLQSLYGMKYTLRHGMKKVFFSPVDLGYRVPSIKTKLKKKDFESINVMMQKFVDMGIVKETKNLGNYSEYVTKFAVPDDYYSKPVPGYKTFEAKYHQEINQIQGDNENV